MEPSVFQFYDKKKMTGSTTESYYKNAPNMRKLGQDGTDSLKQRSLINNLIMSEKDLFGGDEFSENQSHSVTNSLA